MRTDEAATTDADHLYWDEHVARGLELRGQADGAQWELGELANTVESTYGNRDLKKFADAINVNHKTLANCATVVTRFSRRRENVPFGVLEAISRRDDREALADRAERDRWTVKQAREFVAPPKAPQNITKPPKRPKAIDGLFSQLRYLDGLFEYLARMEEEAGDDMLSHMDSTDRRALDRAATTAKEFGEHWLARLEEPIQLHRRDEYESA